LVGINSYGNREKEKKICEKKSRLNQRRISRTHTQTTFENTKTLDSFRETKYQRWGEIAS